MAKTHPAAVDAGYNNWVFMRHAYSAPVRYAVKRATWDNFDWYGDNLDNLLDATDLGGAEWTPPLLAEVFPDAHIVSVDEALAFPYATRDRDTYDHAKAIWIVSRPHIACILKTYDDPKIPNAKIFEERVKLIHP
jgi:hypothetical protein